MGQITDAGKTCGARTFGPSGTASRHGGEAQPPAWTLLPGLGMAINESTRTKSEVCFDGFCFQGRLLRVTRGAGYGLRGGH